jgi:hypothetical protein
MISSLSPDLLKSQKHFAEVFAFLLIITLSGNALANSQPKPAQLGECTVAIFSGAVTADGRPIIWKNRDVSNHDQRFIYYDSYQRNGITTSRFIGDCYRSDTTRIYMGANEHGFAIMNSDSYNLHDTLFSGLDDGIIMRLALETCRTLSDFEAFLDSTNITGRNFCWNFGCLDSTGACAFYEAANRSYRKFDPLDSNLDTSGYLVRSNFSVSGDTLNRSGLDRYQRANYLVNSRLSTGLVDVNWVLAVLARDMGNIYADPYPLPYNGVQLNGPPGYIYNYACTIANRYTSSAVVIRGIRPGENPAFTTIFGILGPPVLSLAFPLWVKAGIVPDYISNPSGAPVYTLCVQRSQFLYDSPRSYLYLNSHYLFDDDSSGVYSYTLPLEAWGIREVDNLFDNWQSEAPTADNVRGEQLRIARSLFSGFKLETARYLSDTTDVEPQIPDNLALYNYPNPFNNGTRIVFSGVRSDYPVILRIFDIAGRLIYEFNGTANATDNVYWTGRDTFGDFVSSGIYFYSLENGPRKSTSKMLLLK